MTPMFHAASMAASWCTPHQGAGARAHHAAVRPGQGASTAIDEHGVTITGDGADDDRHDAEPPRLRRRRSWRSLQHLAYGASPMPAALLDQLQSLLPELRLHPGLRDDRGVGGAHRARPPTTTARAATSCESAGRAAAGRAPLDPGRRRQPAAAPARSARCAPRAATSCASTGTGPTPPPRCSATAGTTPATPATSTTTGYLFLVDRVKDMIVTGGENVYSSRGRERHRHAPRRAAGRGDRHPRRALGRGGARHRRAERGRDGHRGAS